VAASAAAAAAAAVAATVAAKEACGLQWLRSEVEVEVEVRGLRYEAHYCPSSPLQATQFELPASIFWQQVQLQK
jgi:hypothetical protein